MLNIEGNQGLMTLDFKERLPAGALPLKQLFQRKNMDRYFVSPDILFDIAAQLLSFMEELRPLEEEGIYPGLWDLEDIFYDPENHKVCLSSLDRFQQGDKEQDYEWFPEDEKLFGDLVYFDHASQRLSNERLLYKVLIGAARGNVKLPPSPTEADYSEEFYRVLDKEIKNHFIRLFSGDREAGKEANIEACKEANGEADREAGRIYNKEAEKAVTKEVREEKTWSPARWREQLKKTAHREEEIRSDSIQAACREADQAFRQESLVYDMYLLLRRNYHSSLTMSQLLYECMDELEEKTPDGVKRLQAFFYGDQSIQVRDFDSYPGGFRLQMANQIRPFSIGELMLLAADRLDDLLDELQKASGDSHDTGHGCSEEAREIRVHLLADHRLANDRLFQYAFKRLKALRERGISFVLHTGTEAEGEAIDKLRDSLTDMGTGI